MTLSMLRSSGEGFDLEVLDVRAGEREGTRARVVVAGIVRVFDAGLETAFERAFEGVLGGTFSVALETVCDGCALDAEGSDGVFSRKVDAHAVGFATFSLVESVPFWTSIVSVASVCFVAWLLVAWLLVAGPARPAAGIALAPRLRFNDAICGEGRSTYGTRASKYLH
jgi:hypothetical protein